MNPRLLVVLILLVGMQALDVLVHVMAGQIEIMRIVSNVVICLGAVASIFAAKRSDAIILLSGLVYLVLNILFLVENGLINPATDTPRVPLLVFVAGSLLLLSWLRRRINSGKEGA